MFATDLALAAPLLILAGAALFLLVAGAYLARSERLVGLGAMAALAASAVAAVVGPQGEAFSGAYSADAATVFAQVVICLGSLISIPLGQAWFARRGIRHFEFPVLVLLAALGMGMMAGAGDLLSLYIGVELQSLALYVLAALQRDDAKASEAGLKYFVLGALSSGLLLYGAAVKGEVGTGVLFGLVFMVCGLAFKVSAAPFHMWTPDVYEGAPTPVVAFFAGAPKLAAMLLFARVLAEAFPLAADQWRQVLILIALASVAVGALAGLAQTNLKRLWAYSSIANIGYAVLGLAAGTAAGVQAMLVFMALYTVAVIGFFACLSALSRDGRPLESLEDMSGLFQQRPWLSLALTAFALSGLGLPPFAGFWGKYYVFMAAVNSGDPVLLWSAVAALVGSVIAAFYYLRLVKVMWFDPAPGQTDRPPVEAGVIAVGAAAFTFPVVLGVMPLIDQYAKAAAAALGLG